MSTSSPPSPQTPGGSKGIGRSFRDFWQRVSEGRAIDDLWSQFAADARSELRFLWQRR